MSRGRDILFSFESYLFGFWSSTFALTYNNSIIQIGVISTLIFSSLIQCNTVKLKLQLFNKFDPVRLIVEVVANHK